MNLTKHFIERSISRKTPIPSNGALSAMIKAGKPVNRQELNNLKKGREAVMAANWNGAKYIFTNTGTLITTYERRMGY